MVLRDCFNLGTIGAFGNTFPYILLYHYKYSEGTVKKKKARHQDELSINIYVWLNISDSFFRSL